MSGAQSSENELRLVWYNVENAFDTIDDPDTRDEEYLPNSNKQWNSIKYWQKLRRIAKVLRNATGTHAPDIIGLCEIENQGVLEDITRMALLAPYNYSIVHYESNDARGIDVGLLYNPSRVSMYQSRAIRIKFSNPSKRSRDILLVSGFTHLGDTIHLFVNHWPSRRGGQSYSQPARIEAAISLGTVIDSLRNISASHRIIAMGDFNDGPHNTSIDTLAHYGLVSLMKGLSSDLGTHRYKGEWEYLDQWLIDEANKRSLLNVDTMYVYYAESMIEDCTSYPGFQPKRCWMGNFFTRGFSDHLPIVLKLSHNED